MSKPIAYANLPEVLNHVVVTSGQVDVCHFIHCDQFHDTTAEAIAIRDWWLAHPNAPRIVSLGRLGCEGFNIDERDGDNVLIGCTQAEFDAGMAGRGFKMTRDLAKCREVYSVWKVAGTLPNTLHIDHEPTSVPTWQTPMPQRARFDSLRVTHFKAMLSGSMLLPAATNVVIEFTQFSNNRKAWACDYNGARCPFNAVRDKFRSSSEFYSVDNTTTIKLAAWLAACDDPTFPFLSAMNVDMLMDQLDLCEQRGATPFVYFDPVFGSPASWQFDQLKYVMDKRVGVAGGVQ